MEIASIKNNPDVCHFKAKFTAFLKFMICAAVMEYAVRTVYKCGVSLRELRRKHDQEFAPYMHNDDSSDEEVKSNGGGEVYSKKKMMYLSIARDFHKELVKSARKKIRVVNNSNFVVEKVALAPGRMQSYLSGTIATGLEFSASGLREEQQQLDTGKSSRSKMFDQFSKIFNSYVIGIPRGPEYIKTRIKNRKKMELEAAYHADGSSSNSESGSDLFEDSDSD